jgi:hypothetical protein
MRGRDTTGIPRRSGKNDQRQRRSSNIVTFYPFTCLDSTGSNDLEQGVNEWPVRSMLDATCRSINYTHTRTKQDMQWSGKTSSASCPVARYKLEHASLFYKKSSPFRRAYTPCTVPSLICTDPSPGSTLVKNGKPNEFCIDRTHRKKQHYP